MRDEGHSWHTGHIYEDTLTGQVFSALSYVPQALERFLASLSCMNRLPGGLLYSKDIEFEPWPAWEIPKAIRSSMRRLRERDHSGTDTETLKQSAQPDVLIKGTGWRIVVECELSKPFEAGQIVEHFVLARIAYEDSGRRTYHLLLNNTLARPADFDKCIRTLCREFADDFKPVRLVHPLPEDRGPVVPMVLWFSWGNVLRIFEEVVSGEDLGHIERHVLLDRIALLRQGGVQVLEPPCHHLGLVTEVAPLMRCLRNSIRDARVNALGSRLDALMRRREELLNLNDALQVSLGTLKWRRKDP